MLLAYLTRNSPSCDLMSHARARAHLCVFSRRLCCWAAGARFDASKRFPLILFRLFLAQKTLNFPVKSLIDAFWVVIMAIYSLSLGFISRSAERSAVGFSAYISGGRQKDERTGKAYTYTSKKDVVVSRVLAPEGAPEWMKNPSTLWNHAERFEDHITHLRFRETPGDPDKTRGSLAYKEKRLASIQTAQTVMGALPLELTAEQAEVCVEEFLKARFVARGLVVQYAIHWDAGNPHFHALVTRRALVGGEFSKRKDREIVSRPEHRITRKIWEGVFNKHLALAGREERVDCRSNRDRESFFLAGNHEGYHAQRLAERGEYSFLVERNDAVRQKNIEIMCESPEALIHEVSQKRTVFTRKHIETEIIRRVGGDTHLFAILKARVEGLENPETYAAGENFASDVKEVARLMTDKLLGDSQITHRVGENVNRETSFTSAAYQKEEEKIVRLADTLHQRCSKSLAHEQVQDALQTPKKEPGFTLSPEQQAAVHHLCSGPDIRILNGRAGTGKTTLLKAVAEAYKSAGYNVLGTSFQGKAVEIMEKEIGISCKTLDSLIVSWERHIRQKVRVESRKLWGLPYLHAFQKMKDLEKHRLTDKDVIIVDEANMVGGRLWERFLDEAVQAGSKVLIVQDTVQIKSREPGDYGRLFAERFGICETREVMRQKVDWQKVCSALLNDGRILDGLKPYQDKRHIQWQETGHAMKEALVSAYLQDKTNNPDATRMALAYRNRDVEALNQSIRHALKAQGTLGSSFMVKAREFAIGDRVRFTQNDHQGRFVQNAHGSLFQAIKEHLSPTLPQGVKNGTLGTLLEGDGRILKIHLDDGRTVKFNTSNYAHLTHGYAMTIHKSEGSTFDRTFVALDPLLDSATTLVAMTRHRDDVQAFVNREEILDFKALIDRIGYGTSKETLQDYQVVPAQKPYFDRVVQYRDIVMESCTLREEIEGSLAPNAPLYKHGSFKGYQALLAQKKEVAKEIASDWDAHAPFARTAGLRRDVLEVEAGLRQRTLSDLEHRASLQVQGYIDLVRETHQIWKIISATHPPVLAKQHKLYRDYQTLKADRDSLAYIAQENPKLYRPFLRVSKNDGGSWRDYWRNEVSSKDRFIVYSLSQHAKAHEKTAREKAFEEGLNAEKRESYQLVKAYAQATTEAASLFHVLKGSKEWAFSKEELQHLFREKAELRDKLALQIVSENDKHQPFLEKLKTLEDKLLEHATRGEVRKTVRAYESEKDMTQRAALAQNLQVLMHKPEARSLKFLMKQEGLDFERVRFDVAQINGIKHGAQPEYVFNHVRDYVQASRDVGKAWKTQHLGSLQEALLIRKETATRLLENDEALAIFKNLHPDRLKKLEAHAGHTISEKPFVEADRVLSHLRGRYSDLALDLMGTPNKSMSAPSALRFGRKGKVIVHTSGPQEGLWYDFEAGKGGNIFQLVAREKGLDFKEAARYCARFVGIEAVIARTASVALAGRSNPVKTTKNQEMDCFAGSSAPARNDGDEERLQAVFALYRQSKTIETTIAETYLRKVRSISCALPQDLRFLPKGTTFTHNGEEKTLQRDCLASFGRNASGELRSVQLTKLLDDGLRALRPDGEKLPKIQYGASKGSFVTLQHDPHSPRVCIAEGVETGLSIKMAGVQGTIIAAMGIHNIKNYEGQCQEIIICADHDGPESHTKNVIQHTAALLKSQNRTVTIITPKSAGQDFNDVLKDEGTYAVQRYMTKYLHPGSELLKEPEMVQKFERVSPIDTPQKKNSQATHLHVKELVRVDADLLKQPTCLNKTRGFPLSPLTSNSVSKSSKKILLHVISKKICLRMLKFCAEIQIN